MSQKFLSDVVLTTISSGILKVDSDGKIVKAVEGTDYVSSVSAGNLDSLTDVVITSPSADQILVYGQPVGGTPGVNIWYNKTPNYLTPASSINALGDVSINSVAVGNLLSWNGSNWVNWAPNFLTSYTETDPIYTASSWYTTTNNASNWDTAYGWGNHAGLYSLTSHTHSVFTQATSGIVNGEEVIVAGENGFVPASGFDDGGKFLRGDGTWQVVTTDLTGYATETWVGQQGYLTSYTETDPVFAASDVYNVRTADITNWNTAFGWGDHSEAGYLTSYTETDPIYTASSWYTTTNNAPNWDTAYGWGNHAGLYIARVLNHTQGSHSYAYPNPEAWYTIAKVVLNGNCQSMNLFGEYRDLSYYLNTAYKIDITARAECDFLSNNESHTIRVNIVTTSTNKTGFGDKVRVVLTRQGDGVREYELQYYRTTWDGGRWELQEGGGWTLYDTSQTAGTEIPSEHIVYNSNVVASNFYGDNVYINGYAAATQSWVGSQGYLTSYTETDPIYTASSWYTTTNNASNWDTAYGWGDHAGLYADKIHTHELQDITGLTEALDLKIEAESDTLATVTARGYSTTGGIDVNGNLTIQNNGYLRLIAGTSQISGFTVFNAAQSGYLSNRITTSDHARGWGWEFTSNEATNDAGDVYFRVGYNGTDSYLNSGNVGIGTTSPTQKLEVSGNILASKIGVGGSINASYDLYNNGTTYLNGQTYLDDQVNVTSGYSVNFGTSRIHSTDSSYFMGGNVGIGTNSPTGKLSVNGGISQDNIVGRPKAYWGVGGASNGAIVISFPGNGDNYGMVHAVVDIYEYNSNNVSTVIVGGHNWNGRWYAYGANTVGYTDKQIRVAYKDGRYAIIIGDENSSWSYGQVVLRKIQNGNYYAGTMNVSDGYDITQTQDLTTDWMSENLTGLKTTYATVNGNGSGSSNSLFVNGFITGSAHGASERLAISTNTRLWFYDSNAEIYRSGSSMFLYGHDEIRMSSSAGSISVGTSTWAYSNSEPYVAGQVYNGQAGNSRFMFHSGSGVMNVYTDGNFYAVEGTQKVATETWVAAQGYAVQQDIAEAVSNLVNSSPEALDTLGELANALGNDANFATTVTNSLAGKVSKSGDTMTGALTLPYAIFTNDASSRVMYLRGTGNIIQFQDAAATNKWEVVGRQDEFYIYKNDGTGSGMKYYINSSGNHTITGDLSVSGGFSASGYNKSNWDTAYGWGNHATANYWVTSNPDPQIVAAGSVTFQYDVEIQGQLLETSSIRVKENIVDLEPVGDKVSKLRPVRYNKIGTDVQEIGLIAEEVAELFPEVVHYNEDGEAESLNYTRLSVLLLQTVKELSDRIQKLENK